jgi:hypothetical protein
VVVVDDVTGGGVVVVVCSVVVVLVAGWSELPQPATKTVLASNAMTGRNRRLGVVLVMV